MTILGRSVSSPLTSINKLTCLGRLFPVSLSLIYSLLLWPQNWHSLCSFGGFILGNSIMLSPHNFQSMWSEWWIVNQDQWPLHHHCELLLSHDITFYPLDGWDGIRPYRLLNQRNRIAFSQLKNTCIAEAAHAATKGTLEGGGPSQVGYISYLMGIDSNCQLAGAVLLASCWWFQGLSHWVTKS